jgi:hypothetical protein
MAVHDLGKIVAEVRFLSRAPKSEANMEIEKLLEEWKNAKKEAGLEMQSLEDALADREPLIGLLRHYKAKWIVEYVLHGTGPLAKSENMLDQ